MRRALLSSCREPKEDIYIISAQITPTPTPPPTQNTASIMDEGLAVAARPLVQGGGNLEEKPGVCSAGLAFCEQIREQTVRLEAGLTTTQIGFLRYQIAVKN